MRLAAQAKLGFYPCPHPHDPHGPHFHPGDRRGRPLNHDHYFYPKHSR
jgi:hypothetical protein